MTSARRSVYLNPSARCPATSDSIARTTAFNLIEKFHHQLPDYKPTDLVYLDHFAKEFGVGSVLVKNETSRFHFPSIKLLGASWACFSAIAARLHLPPDSDIGSIKQAAASSRLGLLTACEGNYGRAVARMGRILEVPVKAYVPSTASLATVEALQSEGAEVIMHPGTCDQAAEQAWNESMQRGDVVLVTDSTSLDESRDILQLDEQMASHGDPDLVIVPVGAGSLAQAVVSHFRRRSCKTSILTVEPDTAACLWKSLRKGELATTSTEMAPTIMTDLKRALLSQDAWPLLRAGVTASTTVSDYEAHQAALDLQAQGIAAGPTGASSLAALRRLGVADRNALGLSHDSRVVLLCTEGLQGRYTIPLPVTGDDPIALTQTLVRINSASPSISLVPGPGETRIARYITSWLEHRDVEHHWIETTPGRPSLVGIVRGSGGGKSLMLNGHMDTVTLESYDDDPLSGKISEGRIYGRGSADMKGGLAAAMIALTNTKNLRLRGDVILTAVADEEGESIGTEDVLRAGWRADAAIVGEPTNLDILHMHKGFALLEVNIYGVASHGSRPDLGLDAICKAGYFLVELDRHAEELKASQGNNEIGPGSIHASIIKGGEETASYPARCTITIERRTVAGETNAAIEQQIRDLLEKVSREVADFRYDLRVTFDRPPFELPPGHPFLSLVTDIVENTLGHRPQITGAPYWTDSALLASAGIASLIWGPIGHGLHAREEYVDVESIKKVTQALTEIASRFCS